ncbi:TRANSCRIPTION FACTOR S-II ZINC FINGER DOMAIN-CONTAINING PROTEIN [Salix koriyanagi]|uniref:TRANSCRIPTION FACTOR S-II ZINC FINGER DOMAIN-CONTAINING PROTEIN n=1 Tax=Salix koriyanagi TaxID=2511006 RepID=A0A9Q0ZSN4_9ROSI|nr:TRANSCRIPTION FACTOR S-II ZINC FINGER DOMAIN-CONTAINING PROTEIN [Salix koriyanagi]
MGQLEHISNKLDSSMQMGLMESRILDPALQQMSMSNMQMGRMGPGQSSTGTLSQQMSISSNQLQLSEPMSNNNVLKNFSVPNMQTRLMEPQAYNLIPDKFLPKRQLGDLGTVFHNSGSLQSSLFSKRKAPMEPSSNNSMLQKLSLPPKRVAQMEHRPWLLPTPSPNTSGLNRVQALSKRPASSKTGPQQSPVQKNQTGQMLPSSKARNESDSVRSKLRQSLADALALVSQQKDKTTSSGKNSEGEAASAQAQKHEETRPMAQTPGASGTVDHRSEEPKESLPTKDNFFTQNHFNVPKTSQENSNTDVNAGYSTQTSNHDGQELQSSVIFRDEDVSFSDSFFVRDDLLQGNGLSWDPEFLASEIEAELCKLFGGVNKKYKEKGRSLLFNLKDRSNPELREKVMSGVITPGRLCSMTAEELASKELSEWRMAKAEELAQMVVLPDSDVDIRRLVKKTHKGEFQVEVEQDSVTMEVSVGTSSFAQTPPKSEEKEATSIPKSDKMKDKVNAADHKINLEDKKDSYTLTIPSSEGTDLLQGLMVDDVLKDADFLPPIVSLDEFMESLDSEPPFENLPLDAGKTPPSTNNDDSQKIWLVALQRKSDNVEATSTSPEANGKSIDIRVESVTTPSVGVSKGEHIWGGVLQLSISILASVIGIFKSGDKTSAKEWSDFVEVKGRVRLDAFEKFLQELRMSRSRAVMVVHFVCKEGSTESERESLREVADSYVVDERVGFAEPAHGVELYLCPPHLKTREGLIKVLPKDQLEPLNAVDYGSTKKRDTNMNVNIASKHPLPPPLSGTYPNPQPDEDDDDVPPGFGPPASRDEDDLPEFNFSSNSMASRSQFSNQNPVRGSGMPPLNSSYSQTPSRPVDLRELVHRYGQPKTNVPPLQPWNDDDDDDDMPEWHPRRNPTSPYTPSVNPCAWRAAAYFKSPPGASNGTSDNGSIRNISSHASSEHDT